MTFLGASGELEGDLEAFVSGSDVLDSSGDFWVFLEASGELDRDLDTFSDESEESDSLCFSAVDLDFFFGTFGGLDLDWLAFFGASDE